MRNFENDFLELIRLAATDLPTAVEERLRQAWHQEEEGSAARITLETILKNITLARAQSTPMCQDTGTPIFYVFHPAGFSQRELGRQIRSAVAEATRRAWLRPNAVEAMSGVNSGNNLGKRHFPEVYFEEIEGEDMRVDLILKGGGCENVSAQYALPNDELQAGRDLEGVRKAVLHSVWQAQGEGCAPGFLGIAIGGDRASSHLAAKEALTQSISEINPEPALAELEEKITAQANQLGIGPMGLGGKTTLLGARAVSLHRLPASYFVSIAYMCWAYRHRRMFFENGQVRYE